MEFYQIKTDFQEQWIMRYHTAQCVFSTSGDTMSTSGDVQYIGGISRCMWGEQVGKNLSISIENPDVLNIPRRP